MLDDTRSPIGYGLLPPLGQSLSETESFFDTSTSVSQYPFKLHWFSRYLRIRIIYCKFLAQNNCNCAIFTIFNKNPGGQSELAIQKFLVKSWPADGARLGKLRTVQNAANQKYEDEVRVYYLKLGNNASNGCQHQFTELIAAHFCGTHYVEAALWKPCGHVKFKHLFFLQFIRIPTFQKLFLILCKDARADRSD